MRYFLAAFTMRAGMGALLLALAGCVEPYMPAVLDAPASYLVVDGFINGNGITRIKLSRTTNIATTTLPPAETRARLFVVDNTGVRYSLTERGSGSYQSDSLVLNTTRQYQLLITTATNIAYASALVPLKVTPPIDKLDWKLNGNQVQLLLSTHDPQQQSRYYRWGFVETWEFHSAYESFLEYRNGIIDSRLTPIYTCWRTERPSIIRQGSSAQLAQDVLTDFDILSLSSRAERFAIRYSVLVSQYAQTQAEFAYYELLRKNTEAVGTVNDPLPSQLTGNVHRVDNATEPVLGFVGAHTVQTKRLFINRARLPASQTFDSPYRQCLLGEELLCDPFGCIPYPTTRVYDKATNIPIELLYDAGGNILGYSGSSADCADCRTRGTNTKPSFW